MSSWGPKSCFNFHVPFGCNVKNWCYVKHYDQRIGQTWASHPMSIQLYKLLYCHRVIHKVILFLNLCLGCIQGRCFFTYNLCLKNLHFQSFRTIVNSDKCEFQVESEFQI
jgi:hypothetical protein